MLCESLVGKAKMQSRFLQVFKIHVGLWWWVGILNLLLQRYYFLCAGDLGGLLSFATNESGWEYLLSKHWVRDVQIASKLYPGIAGIFCCFLCLSFSLAFPKYSVARSYCKALLTDSLRDLLLPNQQDSNSVEECLENFTSVLDVSRNSSTYVVSDIKVSLWYCVVL